MLVPQMDGMSGQIALQESKVLIVGAGGIGSSAILYMAGAGVGSLTIVDFDVVEESNLHRQVIHDTSATHACMLKAESAASRVKALNPNIECEIITEKLTRGNSVDIMTRKSFDLVVDATDNFDARYLINDTCNLIGSPLVSGSAVGMEGQITVFQPCSGFACYRCLHPNPSPAEACRSCDNAGVVGPVPGIIGVLQAVEVIKLLVKTKIVPGEAVNSHKFKNLVGRQLYYDAAAGEFHEFGLRRRNPECISCKHLYTGSSADKESCSQELFPGDGEGGSGKTLPCSLPPSLAAKHRITASDYNTLVLVAGVPHVLLDVRSELQFGIVSLQPLFTDTESSTLLNVPYSDLMTALKSKASLISGSTLPLLSSAVNSSEGAPLPVYVICRRGVDSVKATQLLLHEGAALLRCDKEGAVAVFNVEGGLTAWHTQVDETFPKY